MRPLTLALVLACSGCACTSPAFNTAARVVELDFSHRASSALLRCEGETFIYSVKVVGNG